MEILLNIIDDASCFDFVEESRPELCQIIIDMILADFHQLIGDLGETSIRSSWALR